MQMVSGTVACAAHITDELAFFHEVAILHRARGQMTVQRRQAAAVIQLDGNAHHPVVVEAGCSVGRGVDGRTRRGGDIHAGVYVLCAVYPARRTEIRGKRCVTRQGPGELVRAAGRRAFRHGGGPFCPLLLRLQILPLYFL